MSRHPDRSCAASPDTWRYGSRYPGFLIVNADDWGVDSFTTDRALECLQLGSVSSVSAMVFMDDSERAANIARDYDIDTALHLNFTTPFAARTCDAQLLNYQQQLSEYLCKSRVSQMIFQPKLHRMFRYVINAQLEEFQRIYRFAPDRIDGHHHMHLCANVILGCLLPSGTLIRRNFSFRRGEKSVWNRAYRLVVDRIIARRHDVVDYFFSLAPTSVPGRLERIASLARMDIVELETHAVHAEEYCILTNGELLRRVNPAPIRRPAAVPRIKLFERGNHA